MREQDIEKLAAAIAEALQQNSGIAEAREAVIRRLSAPGSLPGGASVAAPEGRRPPLPDIGGPEHRNPCRIKAPHKPHVLAELQKATNARIGTGKSGTRPPTSAYLRFLADHARSKGTVFKEVPQEWLDKNKLWSIRSMAEDKNTYLTRPDLGRLISPDALAELKKRLPAPTQVQIVLSDGLSTDALLGNYEEILPPLCKGLKNSGFTVGDPFFLHYGRVKAEDVVGETLGCDVVLLLIGERPGLGQSESMSCYAVYKPTARTVESDRTVISNIHRGGIPPVEAAAVIVELTRNIMRHQASGIALNRKMGGVDA